jgi:hypothetical protein
MMVEVMGILMAKMLVEGSVVAMAVTLEHKMDD